MNYEEHEIKYILNYFPQSSLKLFIGSPLTFNPVILKTAPDGGGWKSSAGYAAVVTNRMSRLGPPKAS